MDSENRLIPAFVYVRVSGASQVDGDGFTRQELAIREYAGGHGYEVKGVYQERGVSGTTEWAGRPAWAEMTERIFGNGVRTILVERLDRLARDLMVQEHIIKDLREKRVELVSVAEPDLCVDDPSRKLLRQIMGAIAEYEKTMIVAKLRGARQRAKERDGRCEGRKPFGYYPGEVAARGEIRELDGAGLTPTGIAAELNKRGLATRSGKPWSGFVVSRIVGREK